MRNATPQPTRTPRQRGIALLTAIFVVALATIAATAMVSSDVIALRRAQNLADSERAWWYAMGVESWSKEILAQDLKLTPKVDGFNDIWAQPVAYFPIDNGSITGHIEDLQGRFNLDSLASNTTTSIQQFQTLLDNLPGIDPISVGGLGQAVQDWQDSDSDRAGLNGFEDSDYLGLDPPYRPPNQPMTSPTELMAVHGFTQDIYTRLRPYVTALPSLTGQASSDNKINVNTAPLAVLIAVTKGADVEKLQEFVKSRVGSPVSSASELTQTGAFPSGTSNLVYMSSYFLVQQVVTVGSVRLPLYSVIYRPASTTGTTGSTTSTSSSASPTWPVVLVRSTDSE